MRCKKKKKNFLNTFLQKDYGNTINLFGEIFAKDVRFIVVSKAECGLNCKQDQFARFQYAKRILTLITRRLRCVCVRACIRANAIKEFFRYKKISASIMSRVFFASLSIFGILVDARREISSTIKSELRKKMPDSIVKRVAVSSKNFDAHRLSPFCASQMWTSESRFLSPSRKRTTVRERCRKAKELRAEPPPSTGVRFDQGSQIYVL